MLSFLVLLGLSFLAVLALSFLGVLPLLHHPLAVFLQSLANPLVCIHRVGLQKNIARLAMKPKVSVVALAFPSLTIPPRRWPRPDSHSPPSLSSLTSL